MSEEKRGHIRFKREGSIVVGLVDPDSTKDQVHLTDFGDEAVSVVKKHPGIALMLDFEHVDYLSSAALTELIRIKEAVTETGGDLRVCGLSPEILKVFEITKLDGDFGVKPGESPVAAVARFDRDVSARAEA